MLAEIRVPVSLTLPHLIANWQQINLSRTKIEMMAGQAARDIICGKSEILINGIKHPILIQNIDRKLNGLLRGTDSKFRIYIDPKKLRVVYGKIIKEEREENCYTLIFGEELESTALFGWGGITNPLTGDIMARTKAAKEIIEHDLRSFSKMHPGTKNFISLFFKNSYGIESEKDLTDGTKAAQLIKDITECWVLHEKGHRKIVSQMGEMRFFYASEIKSQNFYVELDEISADLDSLEKIMLRSDKPELFRVWGYLSTHETIVRDYFYGFNLNLYCYLLEKLETDQATKKELKVLISKLLERITNFLEAKKQAIRQTVENIFGSRAEFEKKKISLREGLIKASATPAEIEFNLWQNLYLHARMKCLNLEKTIAAILKQGCQELTDKLSDFSI